MGKFLPGHVKTAGRVKGTPNKATVARDQEVLRIVAEATAGNLPDDAANATPLEAMLICLRWALAKRDPVAVLAAATAAAPYIHPRLSASDVRVSGPLTAELNDEQLREALADLNAKAAAAGVTLN